MSTVKVTNLTNASSATTNIALDASGNATVGNNLTVTGGLIPSSSFLRNKIINGDMRIDQRNAGASVSIAGGTAFPVDRYQAVIAQGSGHTTQQSTTAPSNFVNSILITVGTGASASAGNVSRLYQVIEGVNIADLNWGSAVAQTITLSFWVRSSLTGTFAGGVYNNAANRTYVFTYTINSANTFEYKTITITGDTTGTWLTNTGQGIIVNWDLGTGSTYQGTAGSWAAGAAWATSGSVKLAATSGATFYITGVQLEVGSVATPFERRQYGTELMLCQRYCIKFGGQQAFEPFGVGVATSGTNASIQLPLPVSMRAAPGAITVSTASNFLIGYGSSGAAATAFAFDTAGYNQIMFNVTVSSGPTAGNACRLFANNSTSASIIVATEL